MIDPEDHSATGFVDIDVPAVTRPLGTGWICTVVAPIDPDASANDPFTLVVEPDSHGWWTVDMLSRSLADWTRWQTGRADLVFSYEECKPTVSFSDSDSSTPGRDDSQLESAPRREGPDDR